MHLTTISTYNHSCILKKILCLKIDSELRQIPEERCSTVNTLIDDQIKLVNQRMIELKSLKKELQCIANFCSSDKAVEQCEIIKSL